MEACPTNFHVCCNFGGRHTIFYLWSMAVVPLCYLDMDNCQLRFTVCCWVLLVGVTRFDSLKAYCLPNDVDSTRLSRRKFQQMWFMRMRRYLSFFAFYKKETNISLDIIACFIRSLTKLYIQSQWICETLCVFWLVISYEIRGVHSPSSFISCHGLSFQNALVTFVLALSGSRWSFDVSLLGTFSVLTKVCLLPCQILSKTCLV